MFRDWMDNKVQTLKSHRPNGNLFVFFGPGLFFLFMGVVTLLAPHLILAMLAGFFVFLGVFFSLVAWKFISLKKRVEETAKRFQGRVFIHGLRVEDGFEMEEEDPEEEEELESEKKFILH